MDYAEGIKLTDPRRMAVYFAKYGTGGRKEYQHHVPAEWLTVALVCHDCGAEYDADLDECPDCGSLDAELVEHTSGPGRFWGYRGLRPVLVIRQVTLAVGIQAGRVMRRWYRSKRLTKRIIVERVEQSTGRVVYAPLPGAETTVRAQPRLRRRERRASIRRPARALPRRCACPRLRAVAVTNTALSVRPCACLTTSSLN